MDGEADGGVMGVVRAICGEISEGNDRISAGSESCGRIGNCLCVSSTGKLCRFSMYEATIGHFVSGSVRNNDLSGDQIWGMGKNTERD